MRKFFKSIILLFTAYKEQTKKEEIMDKYCNSCKECDDSEWKDFNETMIVG